MKAFLTILFLTLYCIKVQAQVPGAPAPPDSGKSKIIRICAPSKGQLMHPPLYIISSKGHEFRIDSLNTLSPSAIKDIKVLKGAEALRTFGQDAQYGVILITIDDKKYPNIHKELKKTAIRFNRPAK